MKGNEIAPLPHVCQKGAIAPLALFSIFCPPCSKKFRRWCVVILVKVHVFKNRQNLLGWYEKNHFITKSRNGILQMTTITLLHHNKNIAYTAYTRKKKHMYLYRTEWNYGKAFIEMKRCTHCTHCMIVLFNLFLPKRCTDLT